MDNYIYFSFFIHMFSMSKLVMSWHLFSHAFLWHVIDRFLYYLTFCQIWSTVGSVQEGNLHFVIPKLRKVLLYFLPYAWNSSLIHWLPSGLLVLCPFQDTLRQNEIWHPYFGKRTRINPLKSQFRFSVAYLKCSPSMYSSTKTTGILLKIHFIMFSKLEKQLRLERDEPLLHIPLASLLRLVLCNFLFCSLLSCVVER